MKRGTTPTLKIYIETIDIENVEKIEFIFKTRKAELAETSLLKSYPDDADYNDGDKAFHLKLKDAETRLFASGSTVFMDTRIVCKDGTIPETDIAEISVAPTLFREVVT